MGCCLPLMSMMHARQPVQATSTAASAHCLPTACLRPHRTLTAHTRTGVQGREGDAGGVVEALVELAHGQHVAHLQGRGGDGGGRRRRGWAGRPEKDNSPLLPCCTMAELCRISCLDAC